MFPEPGTMFPCITHIAFPLAVILVIVLTFIVIVTAVGFTPALTVSVIVTAVAAVDRKPFPGVWGCVPELPIV
jgi:hypothetical protein